ncbi:MAG: hypothetical protein N2606_04650 [Candidatus Omnitrophica bacterium]|nr:hypothetical protein [Candidatus Omnitrophota bacterium]
MISKRIFFIVGITSLILFLNNSMVVAEEVKEPPSNTQKMIGEFSGWNVPVPVSNYNFVKYAIYLFGTRWGEQPTTEQELEDRVWEQLILSYEAFRRNIKVEEAEIDEEIDKMLKSDKVNFDWRKDQDAFKKWVKDKANIEINLFREILRHLLQLEKLRKEVLDSFTVSVTEEEALNEFINEYNTMELELVQFDELKDAEKFFQEMQDPKKWQEQAAKEPKRYQHPGFVSFEFLINMWKIPKEDLYKMLEMEVDSIYPPRPIYRGWGVFRILKKRPADPKEFPQVRDSYFKQVEMLKKYDKLKEWLNKLKEDAKIKIYPKVEEDKKSSNKLNPKRILFC